LQQAGGKWWLGFLAGAIAAWAHLFKETGVSVVGAMGLFVIVQPIFKQRTWKQAGVDILLLLGGATGVNGAIIYLDTRPARSDSAAVLFCMGCNCRPDTQNVRRSTQTGNYASTIRSVMPFADQWPKVLRYYLALCLPVSLALGAIIAESAKWGRNHHPAKRVMTVSFFCLPSGGCSIWRLSG